MLLTLTGWPVYKKSVVTNPRQTDAETARPAQGADSVPESVDRIVEAAIQCFARHGYEGASTKEIALAAGVSKSLLHYHFASKEEILIASVTRLSEGIAAGVLERSRVEAPSVERLLTAADALFDLLIANRERVAFLMEMWSTANFNERLRERIREFDRLQHRLVCDTIRAALGPDAGRLMLPLDRAAALVQAVIAGFVVHSNFMENGQEARLMFEDIKQVLFRGAVALKP